MSTRSHMVGSGALLLGQLLVPPDHCWDRVRVLF